ncbi:MAG: PilZ domain-containing protein [Terracidiphilus sp.]
MGVQPQRKDSLSGRFLSWLDGGRKSADRHPLPGLIAYYFNGGAPQSHVLGDLSASGFYLLTRERWAPGSIFQMTLQKSGTDGQDPEDSISVLAKVARSDSEGVGFQFVMSDFVASHPGLSLPGKGTDKKALERLLQRMKLSQCAE